MVSDGLKKFYNSSPMREGVLCWYPFKQKASILDLSDGVLTELLYNRCGKALLGSQSCKRFDYVVVLDPQDFSKEALQGYYNLLNPHGRLLLAYENPFSLRYWNGKQSPETEGKYDTLFGLDGRVSKSEMQLRLEQAGFEGQKWYYPLTDHWFAREIYSEGYLPNEFLNQRFKPYIAVEEPNFDERNLYREIIRNGAFEFMCGAYLVEARVSAEDVPCNVD